MTPTFLTTTQDGKTVLVEQNPEPKPTKKQFEVPIDNKFPGWKYLYNTRDFVIGYYDDIAYNKAVLIWKSFTGRTLHTNDTFDNRAYRQDELDIVEQWMANNGKWYSTDYKLLSEQYPTRLFATLKQVEKEFVSGCCEGEKCSVCRKPATAKLSEVVFDDDPVQSKHGLTAYVCKTHFNMIVRPYDYTPEPNYKEQAIELLEALKDIIEELDDQALSTSTNRYIETAKQAITKAETELKQGK